MLDASPDSRLTTARAFNQRLRAMEAHLDQMQPAVIHGTDGFAYHVSSNAYTQFQSAEAFPYLSPETRLPALGLDDQDADALEAANDALLHQLEVRFQHLPLQSIADEDGEHMQTSASHVLAPLLHFQVSWLGSRREWHVNRGTITWNEGQGGGVFSSFYEVAADFLPGRSGFITLPLLFTPFIESSAVLYRLSVAGPYTIETTPSNGGPRRSYDDEGVEAWSAGVISWPIAYVESPTGSRRTPLIIPFQDRINVAFINSTSILPPLGPGALQFPGGFGSTWPAQNFTFHGRLGVA